MQVAAAVVDEDELGRFAGGRAWDEDAPWLLGVQAAGLLEEAPGAAAVDDGLGVVGGLGAHLAEHHLIGAVAVEVAGNDVAGHKALQRGAARFVVAAVAVPVDPRALRLAVGLAAGEDDVLGTVASQVGYCYCHGTLDGEGQGRAEVAVRGNGDEFGPVLGGGEEVWDAPQGDGAGERSGVREVRGELVRGLLFRCRHGRAGDGRGARGSQAAGAAPVDGDLTRLCARDQVDVAVAVQVGVVDLLGVELDVGEPLHL